MDKCRGGHTGRLLCSETTRCYDQSGCKSENQGLKSEIKNEEKIFISHSIGSLYDWLLTTSECRLDKEQFIKSLSLKRVPTVGWRHHLHLRVLQWCSLIPRIPFGCTHATDQLCINTYTSNSKDSGSSITRCPRVFHVILNEDAQQLCFSLKVRKAQ